MKKNLFQKNLPWGIMAFLAVGVTIVALAPYVTLNSENFNNATTRYATESTLRYVGLFVHAFAGGIALLLGPFQFLDGFRKRRQNLHRWMGRIYLVSILIGGLSAFIIAPGMISGLVGEVGLMSLAVLWLWTGWNAYSSIRKGDVKSHREWMIRSFALTFAAATLRLWLGTLIATQLPFLQTKYSGDFDALFVEVYRVVMWLCWVPNLIAAEMIIQRRRKPQTLSSIGQNSPQTQNV
ncbi:MAG: DUF2306 domain-containing protein [Anaerolineales bacterium]|nr:DUF2306 domain-containing protein [Anaerolineales bacterium]